MGFLRILGIVSLLFLLSYSSAQEFRCSTEGTRTEAFSDFVDPVIGFTGQIVVEEKVYAGWYIIERDTMSILRFKSFFLDNEYIDGLEIGERFVTPRSEWENTEFLDFPNTLVAYEELSQHAPTCRFVYN